LLAGGVVEFLNYLGCQPKEPDAKCMNCKRHKASGVVVKNSKDKACIYIPISLQKKP
jgi:hypothetical protein